MQHYILAIPNPDDYSQTQVLGLEYVLKPGIQVEFCNFKEQKASGRCIVIIIIYLP